MSVPAPDPTGPDPTDSHRGQSPGDQSPGDQSPTGEPSRSARAGRRQHHRPAGARPGDSTEELVYLSGRVPRALRDEVHIAAIGEARPVVELLRDAIRSYLDHTPSTPPR